MILVCVNCGKKVNVDKKHRYTSEGKELNGPFLCDDCQDLLEEWIEPDDTYSDIENFYPSELDVGVLV
jgi:hypothetical protein